MLYSYQNNEPQPLPYRIRLSSGLSRTDPATFTEQEIVDAGYVLITQEKPVPEQNQIVYWSKEDLMWIVRDKTEQELQNEINYQWTKIRKERDNLLSNLDWRFIRYESQTRLGIVPVDSIQDLDTYAQALRDVTLQQDPFNIVWPEYSNSNVEPPEGESGEEVLVA